MLFDNRDSSLDDAMIDLLTFKTYHPEKFLLREGIISPPGEGKSIRNTVNIPI